MPTVKAKPVNLQKEIIRAAKSGNLARVKELLEEDPSLVSARDTDDSTPLHCATWKGHKAVVELLLKNGADVNARNSNDHWGTTPLHAAAHANQRDIAAMLIATGCETQRMKSEPRAVATGLCHSTDENQNREQ